MDCSDEERTTCSGGHSLSNLRKSSSKNPSRGALNPAEIKSPLTPPTPGGLQLERFFTVRGPLKMVGDTLPPLRQQLSPIQTPPLGPKPASVCTGSLKSPFRPYIFPPKILPPKILQKSPIFTPPKPSPRRDHQKYEK